MQASVVTILAELLLGLVYFGKHLRHDAVNLSVFGDQLHNIPQFLTKISIVGMSSWDPGIDNFCSSFYQGLHSYANVLISLVA